jgi:microcystin-dependent protein
MSCTNCFNGCPETGSDKCIQYTGVGSQPLGISTGDTLLSVENVLINRVVSFLDGQGIRITTLQDYLCALITPYLDNTQDPTLPEVLVAFERALCDLQTQTTAVTNTVTGLNTGYTTTCLSGVNSTSTIKQVVQAIIVKLCSVSSDLTALTTNVNTNYVKLADLNSLIAAYLQSIAPSAQYYTKMVPYTVVEYYGSLAGNFDVTGKGIAATGWDKVYLCNGLNGTPDKRGRSTVGAIVGVGGGALDAEVNPASSAFNPNYALNTKTGTNSVTLSEDTMPSHNHATTAIDSGHFHYTVSESVNSGAGAVSVNSTHPIGIAKNDGNQTRNYELVIGNVPAIYGITSTNIANIVVTNPPKGGNQPHANIQPVISAYYIMYIP